MSYGNVCSTYSRFADDWTKGSGEQCMHFNVLEQQECFYTGNASTKIDLNCYRSLQICI